MAIRRIRVHGRKVWQARVAFRGLRKSRLCESKDQARQAEAELLQELTGQAAEADEDQGRPATFKALLELYAQDMAAREKGEESVGRVEYTARAVEALMPGLLEKPVSEITDADIFAFEAEHGATMALNRGFTAPIVMALGGWKTERMMRRYAAVTDQTLRAATEAISGGEAAGAMLSEAVR